MDILWWIIIAGILVWIFGNKKKVTEETVSSIPDIVEPPITEIVNVPHPINAQPDKILDFLRSTDRQEVLDRYYEVAIEHQASDEIISWAILYRDLGAELKREYFPHPITTSFEKIKQCLDCKFIEDDLRRYREIVLEYGTYPEIITEIDKRINYLDELYRDPIHDPVPTHPDLLRGTVVSVAGRFIQSERLYQILSECGATFQKAVTDETTILLQGSNPSIHALAKVKKLQTEGFDIRIMKQAEFYDLIRELHKNQI